MTRRLPLQAPLALFLCLLAPLAAGCVAVAAGAGVGYIISQDVLPEEVYRAQVRDDADRVFRVASETLGFRVEPGTEVEKQEFPRVAKGKVDGADVTLTVEAYDIDRTIIEVKAERPLRRDGALAEEILNDVLRRLKEE